MRTVSGVMLASRPMHISVGILQAISEAEHGLTKETLRELGLGDALPSDPGAPWPWPEAARALDRALALCDERVVLRAGAEMTPRALQLVGLAMLSARTIGDVLGSLVRFLPLVFSPASLQLIEVGDEGHLTLEVVQCSPRLERAVAEFFFASFARTAKEVYQYRPGLRRVWFRHQAPMYDEEYRRILGCPVSFKAQNHGLSFPREALGQSLPGGDAAAFAALTARAEQVLLRPADSSSAVQFVKRLLDERGLAGPPSIASAARLLGVSVSTLKRQLSTEGTSYRALVDEARRERALELLAGERLPNLEALCAHLGFSEVRAFSRAFRRWTGMSVSAYRSACRT